MATDIIAQGLALKAGKYDRLKTWARLYQGVGPVFPTMASPPTFTRGTVTSSVDSNYNTGTVTQGVYALNTPTALMPAYGANFIASTDSGLNWWKPQNITGTTGVTGSSGPFRWRFMSDAPAIDFCFLERAGTHIAIIVDGQMMARKDVAIPANTGNIRYFKLDFGANVTTYEVAQEYNTVTAAGTGYAVGDLITVNGGSGGAGGTGAVYQVSQLSGSGVFSAHVLSRGAYTSQPTGTFSQASTTGSGTGFQMQAQFFYKRYSTRKMREIEIVWTGPSSFIGVVVDSLSRVTSYRPNLSLPKLVGIGDSISAGTYLEYAGASPPSQIAQRLGLWDQHVVSAAGGTGWNIDNAGAARWSHANRIADMIGLNGDIYLFLGSQNDTAGTALETAITSTLNQLQAALPNAIFVGIGNINGGNTTLSASIGNGWAGARDQKRVRYINNWFSSAGSLAFALQANWPTLYSVTDDAAHPSGPGIDFWSYVAADAVGNALYDIAAKL